MGPVISDQSAKASELWQTDALGPCHGELARRAARQFHDHSASAAILNPSVSQAKWAQAIMP